MLEKEAILLKEAEESQVVESKRKEIIAGDGEEQWLSKKARGKQLEKYRGGATVKMGGCHPLSRGVCAPGRIAWCTPQSE